MLIIILMALLMSFQGNSNYLLSISEAEMEDASSLQRDAGSGDGVARPSALMHWGGAAFPSSQPAALPLLRQQWKIPFCLKGELHAKSRWQDQEISKNKLAGQQSRANKL